jgi:very-short-patch-repair endonuclease
MDMTIHWKALRSTRISDVTISFSNQQFSGNAFSDFFLSKKKVSLGKLQELL